MDSLQVSYSKSVETQCNSGKIIHHFLQFSSASKLAEISEKYRKQKAKKHVTNNLFTLVMSNHESINNLPTDLWEFMHKLISSIQSCKIGKNGENVVDCIRLYCPSIENHNLLKIFIPFTSFYRLYKADNNITSMVRDALDHLNVPFTPLSVILPGINDSL